MNTIPIIDIADIWSADSLKLNALAEQFLEIYSTYGFAYIINHGVNESLRDTLFKQSDFFHNLPIDEKMQIALNSIHRGYIPINTSTDRNTPLAKIDKPNQSESFIMMREDDSTAPEVINGDYLAGSNQWPAYMPEFKTTVTQYNQAMQNLAERIMFIFARALNTDYNQLKHRYFSPATTWLRLLCYPPAPVLRDADLFGSAPHCDFGCITLLAQDENSGLQVASANGEWINASPIQDALVLNVGNMLNRLSNGKLLSTPHRVINTSDRQRFSCAFFYDPNVKANIAPLSSCVSENHPRQYNDKIVFGDYLKHELSSSYDAHADNKK